MKSNDHAQQVKVLLQSIGKHEPIYWIRTPHGKRILQMPHSAEITNKKISAIKQSDTLHQLLADPVR